jgi:transposase InsO family protein
LSVDNLLWGAPRIHGELLKLGFAVAQSIVAKYMARKGDPFGQSWGTFLRNHAPHIAAMDLFVVPTIGFNLVHVLVIVRRARRELVWINVTAHPTAEWIAQQITEAFPWNEIPRYLIRDRDGLYGAAVTHRLRAMGIRDKPITPGSPWQNCFAERLIGSLRRECVDHIVALDEQHLRQVLKILCELLQHRENAPLIGQGCATHASNSADRTDRVTCPDRRTASPIYSNLSFRHIQGEAAGRLNECSWQAGISDHVRGLASRIP